MLRPTFSIAARQAVVNFKVEAVFSDKLVAPSQQMLCMGVKLGILQTLRK
jgi:hypothetical protein